MDKQLTFRSATLNDVTSLRELAISSFVHAYEQYNTPADMQKYLAEHFSEENVIREIFDEKILFLLAMNEKQIVGYAKLLFQTQYAVAAENPIEIARLYTRVEKIGTGVGKLLVEEIARYAAHTGFDAICLGVWQKNIKAVRFYEREGFTITGTTTFVLGTDVQDDFIMIRKLIQNPFD